MDERTKVVIDAGHGGETDPGAVAYGRRESEDNLRLALAVGNLLEQNGVDVVYTRVSDVYNTPFEKAQIANRSGADYFVSLHRNAASEPGTGSGTMTLVYEGGGTAQELAESINQELARTGFTNLGTFERPDLIVLRRTQMPAVLVELGYLSNAGDAAKLRDDPQSFANGLYNGLREYFDLD